MELKLTLAEKKKLMTMKKASKDWLKVNKDLCTGCGNCAIVCEMNLYQIRNGKAIIKANYKELCYECGACYLVCEPDAIEFNFPPGGDGVVFKYG